MVDMIRLCRLSSIAHMSHVAWQLSLSGNVCPAELGGGMKCIQNIVVSAPIRQADCRHCAPAMHGFLSASTMPLIVEKRRGFNLWGKAPNSPLPKRWSKLVGEVSQQDP